ncbi:hypothetical protein EJ04DRAFT_562951 [Polyplosphaeria fusca]|uniref:Uncharacterized protein n=1 Tax=Polyplosphaeria fusca TaxID=682080 RepID=A0A9P4R2S2_9PLEO|nr:hypothetical protein EJ04DRAFT_562951 [Polyplosphaeria fusca]
MHRPRRSTHFHPTGCYSRFVRNSPHIATAHGEMFFDPKDYMHLRHPHYYPNQHEAGGIGMRKRAGNGSLLNQTLNRNANAVGSPSKEDGEAVPKAIKDNYRERFGMVKNGLIQEFQELEERERTQMLVDAVDKVQRNFWVTVADEMERATGKLYDAKVVEARYRAVQN